MDNCNTINDYSVTKVPKFSGIVSKRSHINKTNVKSKDTRIEIELRKALWHKGIRYRKNYKKLPGKPDIAITKYKIAVFCDGEFFHGKDWDILKPKLEKGTNADYWVKKIQRNIERDEENDKALAMRGWTVIHFWGKDILKNSDECARIIEEIVFEKKIEIED